MTSNEKKRQKKLMKKRQKDRSRKKKQSQAVSFSSSDPRKKIMNARNLPFYECLINSSWKENGLAKILISRKQQDGKLLFGTYLVDILCLGLKNTFCNADITISQYKVEMRNRMFQEDGPLDCPLPTAHHIIYGGIDYAAQFGFKPNKDFRLSKFVLEDIRSVAPCEPIEFGKDGKPVYIAGPDDDPERIIKQLETKLGKDNFNYTVKEI